MQRRRLLFGSAAGAALWSLGPLVAACGDDSPGSKVAEARADTPRIAPTDADRADANALAADNAAFAWNLYARLAASTGGNLFYSPYSISLALAMAFAGASGSTASEMAAALHYQLPGDRLHRAFNALDQQLSRAVTADKTVPFTLNIANSAWAQSGHPFAQPYLETIAANYGAGIQLTDFIKQPEPARVAINNWVSDHTNHRIEDLLPAGSVTELTRLVLANAVYFKANWLTQFDKNSTRPGAFTSLDGRSLNVPKMNQTSSFAYAQSDGVEAVELPYVGETTSMVILLPAAGTELGALESRLVTVVPAVVSGLKAKRVALSMPTWGFTNEFSLAEQLKALGMASAFDPGAADFSGMDNARDLYVSGVFHKAFVKVDEQGTEAAAATGVVVGTTAAPADPPTVVDVNRPFVFLIRDVASGSVLFAGRVTDPSAG